MSESFQSIETIEQMTLECAEKMAGFMQEQEQFLSMPDQQIYTFQQFLPGNRILDVGCGTARYADEFPKRGMEYIGVDFSPKMLAIARSRHPTLDFRQMNLRTLAFPDSSFDGIWCCCALGSTPKRLIPEVLADFKRLLVTNGALLVMLPNAYGSGEYVGETRVPGAGVTYHADWDLEEFREALLATGFQIKKALSHFQTGTNTFLALAP